MFSKALAILALSTMASVATCSLIANGISQSKTHDQFENKLVFPELRKKIDDISAIEITRASGQFLLTKQNKRWKNQGLGGFPTDDLRIEKTIKTLSKLHTLAAKTKRTELHHKLGVERINEQSNSTQLTLKTATGTTLAAVVVGKQKGGFNNQQVYIRLPDSDQAWLASGSFDVAYDAVDWSDRSVTDFAASSISSIKLGKVRQAPVILEKSDEKSAKLTVKNLPAGSRVVNQFQIDYVAGALEKLSFLDARPSGSNDSAFPALLGAEFELLSQLSITLLVIEFHEDGSAWTKISAKSSKDAITTPIAEKQATAINSKFSAWHVRLPRKTIERLKIQLDDIVE